MRRVRDDDAAGPAAGRPHGAGGDRTTGAQTGRTGPSLGPGLAPRRPWRERRVLLGVSGGIAAYKAVQLARELTRLGAVVDVVQTRAALDFVGTLSFEGVTGRPPLAEILAPGRALDHIRLAREGEVVCIAPATADLIARAAMGRADDLLTAILLATRSPVLVCPAMNDRMYAHAQTQENLRRLRELGYGIVGPATGPLAFGEGEGPGRLEEPGVIIEHLGRALEGETVFAGRKVVVTAGPTREPLDPVRFLSNRSSGRMGFALAAAAWRRGADVQLISGPTAVEPPVGPELQRVETAEDMLDAVRTALAGADVLLMAAAVADFRPEAAAVAKIKKESAPAAIELTAAPDILLATRDARAAGTVVVGFALETDEATANARRKLESKALDLVVLNEALEAGAGFEVDTNRVVILDRHGGEDARPLMSKHGVAEAVLDRVVAFLEA